MRKYCDVDTQVTGAPMSLIWVYFGSQLVPNPLGYPRAMKGVWSLLIGIEQQTKIKWQSECPRSLKLMVSL